MQRPRGRVSRLLPMRIGVVNDECITRRWLFSLASLRFVTWSRGPQGPAHFAFSLAACYSFVLTSQRYSILLVEFECFESVR